MNVVTEAIHLNDDLKEEENVLIYLGSKFTTDSSCDTEVQARISRASQAFGMSKKIWKARNTSLKIKLRFFKSNVLTLLYCAESWKITNTFI